MSPKIHSSFWSDPDIENQSPEIKLALLWLITNPQTSIIGVCSASPRRFAFETGLDKDVLQRAIQALPRALFVSGDSVFIRGFLRHQFGTGSKLTRNNIYTSILSEVNALKDHHLQQEICKEYPEILESYKALGKGLQAQREGEREGEGTREGKGEEVQEEGGGELALLVKVPSSKDLAEEIYEIYPRKVGKPEAIKSILRAMRKFPTDFLRERTALFAKMVADAGVDTCFVANPATWFNQERFNDDPKTWIRESQRKYPPPTNGTPQQPAHRLEKQAREFPEVITGKIYKP